MSYDITIGRDKSDKERFGKNALGYIGKGFIKMGQYNSLSNRIFLDVARSHVVLVAGKRGSGKSYSLGVLAEEITNLPKEVSQNIAPLIFDTMGIYWTMKFQNEKDKKLLEEWDLKPKNLPVKVYVPFGHYDEYSKRNIPVDEKFALAPWELEAEEWVTTFGLKLTNPISVLIVRVLTRLKEKKKYTIADIISEIGKDKKTNNEIKNAAEGLFESALDWGIFATDVKEATQVEDLVSGGKTTVLDLSVYSSIGSFNVRALTISLVARNLFNERIYARKQEEIEDVSKGLSVLSGSEKKEHPLVWMFIDEAHEFLPLDGKTVATDALVQLLREGRQPGISMVLATQQPGKIHRDVMTQSDIVLSHRVTAQPDVEALNFIMQSYLYKGIKKQMDDLPRMKGSAIVLDDNSERIYPIRIRPRFTWHGGEAPTAIHGKKD